LSHAIRNMFSEIETQWNTVNIKENRIGTEVFSKPIINHARYIRAIITAI
jgi:hypothetical protein